MHSKIYRVYLFIFIMGSSLMFGQRFFSPFFPVDNFTMNARSMAMGGARYDLTQNSALSNFDGVNFLLFDLGRKSYTEKRSFPVIDMFGDVVTQNVYVLNRPSYSSFSWLLAIDLGQYINFPISLSLSNAPMWDMRYEYSEEVRASLGSGNYNRDPLVGYHILDIYGTINSLKIDLATKVLGTLRLGFSIEKLYDNDLSMLSGTHNLNNQPDDALASDETSITDISLHTDEPLSYSFGGVIDLKQNSFGLHFKPSFDVGFNTSGQLNNSGELIGLIPMVDERTQLPFWELSDSSSSYSFRMPQEFSLSVLSRVKSKTETVVTGGIVITDWENSSRQIATHKSSDTTNFNYHSTMSISFGVEHNILDKVPLRFGFIYSESPLGDEFEITKITIGTGWVFNNLSLDIAAVFGGVEYLYPDLFVPSSQSTDKPELVNESNAVMKATIKYSF